MNSHKINLLKNVTIYVLLLLSICVNAQRKNNNKEKDTIKTEIVNVISAYNPTIADAFKISKKPTISLSSYLKKRELSYSIFSAPVASTFIPKSGALKGIKVGPTERLFNNYIAVGYGNFNSPLVEVYLHKARKFVDEFGIYANYQSAEDGVKNAVLNNGFSNISLGGYYTKKDRFFDWKIGVNAFQKQFNWYGLPQNISFSPTLIPLIDEGIQYNFYEVEGEIIFENSYIESISSQLSLFNDDENSNEILFSVQSKFDFPLEGISRDLKNLELGVQLDYLTGDFRLNYPLNSPIDYGFFNLSMQPVYRFEAGELKVKLGAKSYLALDTENSFTDVLFYPDILLSYPLVSNLVDVYMGAVGDLYLNSFQGFTEVNPFVSPTLSITQSNEQYNIFAGLNGKITSDLSFNFKVAYKSVEDQALFVRNNSKSDGTIPVNNSLSLRGFEYGNSFAVLYDDIKTLSISTEIEMALSNRFSLHTTAVYHNYTLANQSQPWNLPALEASTSFRYKYNKWHATANLFYVGKREDFLYSGTFISTANGTQNLEAYTDVNLTGGYDINSLLSIFIHINNLLNNDYERFANFNVQGFQILGGLTYKFDF